MSITAQTLPDSPSLLTSPTQGILSGFSPHTVVKEEFGGHGLASILVQQALDTSIEEGFKIVALCPYVKAWLKKHPDYQKHVDKAEHQHIEALSQ